MWSPWRMVTSPPSLTWPESLEWQEGRQAHQVLRRESRGRAGPGDTREPGAPNLVRLVDDQLPGPRHRVVGDELHGHLGAHRRVWRLAAKPALHGGEGQGPLRVARIVREQLAVEDGAVQPVVRQRREGGDDLGVSVRDLIQRA